MNACVLVVAGFLSFCLDTTESPSARNNARPVELLGVAVIPGTAKDFSGMDEAISEDATNDMLGGLSGMAWTGNGDRYLAVADRGPADGAVNWTCRVQELRIQVNGDAKSPVSVELLSTKILHDKRGLPYTGLATAYTSTESSTHRLDPEGIRIASNGSLFVSDEYGPHLIEFSAEGHELRRFEVPARYHIASPGIDKKTENASNTTGRSGNRGMEGLALSDDGATLYGVLQSPLLQDCARKKKNNKPWGLNCRLPRFSIEGTCDGEWLYRLDEPDNVLNEILTCGESSFLVIERDGEAGNEARFKEIVLIACQGASDISAIDRLPVEDQPDGVAPVQKQCLIDLLDPQWNLAGETMPEKIECLCFGPDLPDGRRLLVIASDNDFVKDSPTVFYVFALDAAALTLTE